ncbi:MAG: helix-turn-helix domain-containing protein, partial [Pseudomonadota bacterium]
MKNNWPELVKQLRIKFSLSQSMLSEMTGVSQKTISRWERGEVAPSGPVQNQLIEMLRRPTSNLMTSMLNAVKHCPAPRALSRMPNLRLLAVSPPAIEKRPSIVNWVDHDLSSLACGILEEMLDDRQLQRSIALQEVTCVVTTTDSVLKTSEHATIGKFQTTITYFSHDGSLYSDAVSVPAAAAAVRGYRPIAVDNLIAD